jgi:threonine dehydrogenase-like Zn-dependent dehydrogenase
VLLGVDALNRREGTLLIQGELAAFPDFPVKKVTEKAITIKSARGHSFRACELAVKQLASGRFPLELLATHTFGLGDVDRAIKAVGGAGGEDVIHVSLLPWQA